jgi:hypothetical protein
MSPPHSHAPIGGSPFPAGLPGAEIDHIGPVTIQGTIGAIGGAQVYAGTVNDGAEVLVCHWGAGKLSGASVPRLAQLIEGLQEERAPGLATVAHGFVGAEEAAIAFVRPSGEALDRRVARDVASPVEALAGALNLTTGLERAAAMGIAIGRWDPSLLISLDERPAWVLLAPGIHGLPTQAGRPALASVIEAAACAPEVATGTLEFDIATPEERVASEAYALGASIYYAVTGALPLGGADPEAYLRSQLGSAPRPLAEIAPVLDRFRRLDEVLRQCLERAPTARPQSYADLRALLESALREAERLDDDAAFLPARLSDTMEIRRMRLREPEPQVRPRRLPERAVQVAALFLLVAILVFLVLWQTRARRGAGGDGTGAAPSLTQTAVKTASALDGVPPTPPSTTRRP